MVMNLGSGDVNDRFNKQGNGRPKGSKNKPKVSIVGRMVWSSTKLSEVVFVNVGIIITYEKSIMFWRDAWMRDLVVKLEFLRLFALAQNKDEKLCEYGQWMEIGWQWQIELRRQLFGWEYEQWTLSIPKLQFTSNSFKNHFKRDVIWSEVKWSEMIESYEDIYRRPSLVSIAPKQKPAREKSMWEAPSLGWVKFDVDGASTRNPNQTGIEGIVRNYKGDILLRFSKSMGVCDANCAEIMAVREAFILFTKILRQTHLNLWIESDSTNVIRWLKDLLKTPWRHRQCMGQIGCF
ncbi:Uncharacterized protein TCM_044395 [Theobroma cacao]|uniref:RNase H type-1 domain-containing protein n=1 Tax=Theobroma cacao TaxID=3641 RepID=A0A061FQI2_THECC|nr:Uncharacterized protein TCM_044395 [Theobroma cacao]